MSYTKKLTTFTKGNYKSDCGEYNVEDLLDMFSDTQFTNSELYLEDVLTENDRTSPYNAFTLSADVTVMEELDDDEGNMYILLNAAFETEVECSAGLDYEFQQQSE